MSTQIEHPSPAHTAGVLSIYLNVDQSILANRERGFETLGAATVRQLEQAMATESTFDRVAFQAASRQIVDFLSTYEPKAKGLALFATPIALHAARELYADMTTEAHWGNVPHIQPYLEAVDEFERCILVLTDKWHGRVMSIFMGHIEYSENIEDDPRTTHIRTAGMDHILSQSGHQRKADERMMTHLRHLVDSLTTILSIRPSKRILLAGNVEAMGELFRLLPKHLQPAVAGTLHLPVRASDHDILAVTAAARAGTERQGEESKVDRLITAAAKQHAAVVGRNETLAALRSGSVFELLYAEHLNLTGGACPACDSIFTFEEGASCGFCGQPLETSGDLMNLILIKALTCGARVEQVRGDAAERLKGAGGIGAFLRY